MPSDTRPITSGLTDAEFIELLWRCVNLGGELMPPDMPASEMLSEWSQAQEDATVERHRREIANADKPPHTSSDEVCYVGPDDAEFGMSDHRGPERRVAVRRVLQSYRTKAGSNTYICWRTDPIRWDACQRKGSDRRRP